MNKKRLLLQTRAALRKSDYARDGRHESGSIGVAKPSVGRAVDLLRKALAEIQTREWKWDLKDKRGRVGVLLHGQRVPSAVEEKTERLDNPDRGP